MQNDRMKDVGTDDRTMVTSLKDIEDAMTGPHRASLIVIAGWEIGREIKLTEAEHVFGRSSSVDVHIELRSISRKHARIDRHCKDDVESYVITDLNSSNGTLVNNVSVNSAPLKNGDKIRMGDVLFKFVIQDPADELFHRDIHRLIHYDQLTGLLTMAAFRRQLETEMRRTPPEGFLTLAMTDLDGLKRVNDTYGHLAGSMVVREMGAMIREAIREQDRAGLYGGDEAVLFFPKTRMKNAMDVAERLRTTIEQRVFEHHGETFQVTISQGLSEWPLHGRSVDQIIAAADGALYDAKTDGRNCIRCAEG